MHCFLRNLVRAWSGQSRGSKLRRRGARRPGLHRRLAIRTWNPTDLSTTLFTTLALALNTIINNDGLQRTLHTARRSSFFILFLHGSSLVDVGQMFYPHKREREREKHEAVEFESLLVPTLWCI